jgi:quinol monooxygenase YgiN
MLKPRRSNFGVVAHISGLTAKVDELRSHLLILTCLTRREKGCISCEVIENDNTAAEFTLIEEWSNVEMHELHFTSMSIRVALRSLSNLLTHELQPLKHISRLNTVRYGINSYCYGLCYTAPH